MRFVLLKKGAAIMLAASLISGYTPIGEIPDIIQPFSIRASADEDVVEVSTWNQLKQAVNDEIANQTGKVIKFSEYDSENNWYISVSPDDPTAADEFFSIPYGSEITIDLNGKKIDRKLDDSYDGDPDKAQENGFVFKNEGTLTLKNSKTYTHTQISGGHNTSDGGAIYNTGVLTLDNVDIEYSYSESNGGGIYNAGTLIVKGGALSNNRAAGNGGCIYNAQGGVLSLNDTSIYNNLAGGSGGAVYNDFVLSLDGTYDVDEDYYNYTSIRDNKCVGKGGGIYNTSSGEISMNTPAIVEGNYIVSSISDYNSLGSENVYLQKDQKIKVKETLVNIPPTNGNTPYRTGVTIADFTEGCTFTNGFAAKNPNSDPYDFFFADTAHKTYDIVLNNGEAGFAVNSWVNLQAQIDAIAATESHKGEIKLEQDVIYNSNNTYCNTFSIPGGSQYIDGDWVEVPPSDITIDLNGHTIDGKGKVNIFSSGGTLTIKDSAGNSGKITGGYFVGTGGYEGPVVTGGTVIVEGGTITGNNGTGTASAVFGEVNAVLKGGVITDNIYDNSSSSVISGSVSVCGTPQIYDNYLADNVNWQYNDETGEYDRVIISKTKKGLSDITVTGKLENGARIDVNAISGRFTTDYGKYNTEDPASFFTAAKDGYSVVLDTGLNEAIVRKTTNYFTGTQLTLDSSIAVSFGFDLAQGDYVNVEWTWGSDKKSEQIYSGDSSPALNISAKQMSDVIHYCVYKSESDYVYNNETDDWDYVETKVILEKGDYCVKTDYLDKLLDMRNTQYAEKDRKMALAAANYGAAAQSMFNYNTDNLANDFSALGENAYTCNFAEPDLSNVSTDNPYGDCVYNNETVLKYYGTSLLLNEQPAFRQYIWLKDPSDYRSWGLAIKGTDGTYNYETYAGIGSYGYYSEYLARYEDGSDYFYYETKGLAPQRLLKDYTIHLYNNNSDSSYNYSLNRRVYKEEIYCTYSPLSYIKLALDDNDTHDAALALYQYAKTAQDYLSE